MSHLVDTDWVADYLKARPDAVQVLRGLISTGVAISLITYGEIYEGISFGRDPKLEEAGFRRFLRFADVVPLNRGIMRQFATLRGTLRIQGLMIGDMDILIAATARYHNMTLLTRNVRHFQRNSGLSLYGMT